MRPPSHLEARRASPRRDRGACRRGSHREPARESTQNAVPSVGALPSSPTSRRELARALRRRGSAAKPVLADARRRRRAEAAVSAAGLSRRDAQARRPARRWRPSRSSTRRPSFSSRSRTSRLGAQPAQLGGGAPGEDLEDGGESGAPWAVARVEHRQVSEHPAVDVEQRHAHVAHGARPPAGPARSERAGARCRGSGRAAGRPPPPRTACRRCACSQSGTNWSPSQKASARRRRDSPAGTRSPRRRACRARARGFAPGRRRSARRSRCAVPSRIVRSTASSSRSAGSGSTFRSTSPIVADDPVGAISSG